LIENLKPQKYAASRRTEGGSTMEKCIGCGYYDRQGNREIDARGVRWGQCRRGAPSLHPINQKPYMIEGVWPYVRDDDWCGEWKVDMRASDESMAESVSVALPLGPLMPMDVGPALGEPPPPKPARMENGSSAPAPALASVIDSYMLFPGHAD
jgi:hypothetical protein